MGNRKADAAGQAAINVVASFVHDHNAAAIPALIGACVLWAVEHGGTAVIQGSLKRAVVLANQMHHARKDAIQ